MTTHHACPVPQVGRRGRSITRVFGSTLRVVGSMVATVAVAMGAVVYLMVAWGQHRRRNASGRAARV